MGNKKKFLLNKKCILLGETRHIYEFAYMFDFLNIEGYISMDETDEYVIPYKKIPLAFLDKNDNCEYVLVVCSLELDKYASALQNKEFIKFEECFELLDPFTEDILNNRKIAVWGTGETERNLCVACKENEYAVCPDIYIDGNPEKSGSRYKNRPVMQLSEVDAIKQYFIIVASIYYRDIKKELDNCGLTEGKDYLPFSSFMSKPSKMMKQQICAKPMKDFYCNRPYTWFYYAWYGAYSCCSTWVKYPIGNPAADTPEACWNSAVAKLYRLSADTRTYCHCKMDCCGLNGKVINHKKVENYNIPEEITLGLDYTCNLHCASCREHVQVVSGEQLRIRQQFAEEIIRTGWLEKTKKLELSGSGEALFSKIDREILFSNTLDKREAISLLTNGLLLNEDNLEKLKKHFKRIRLNISIDAATEETYRKLRRGGDWNTLLSNLEKVRRMREKNELEYVEIKMVVQKSNYKEMVSFIEMGKRYRADKVVFTKLLNWDMFSEEQYLEEALLKSDGSLKKELLDVFENDIFSDKIVNHLEFLGYLNLEKKGVKMDKPMVKGI